MSTPTIRIVMIGQLPTPPYQQVTWVVYNQVDNTGAQSGYGANYLINIGVDPNGLSVLGNIVNPMSMTAGGDLTGSFPNPYVVGLQGNPVSSTTPSLHQTLVFDGTAWVPASSLTLDNLTSTTLTSTTLTANSISTGELISSDLVNADRFTGSTLNTETVESSTSIQSPLIKTTLISSESPNTDLTLSSTSGTIGIVSGANLNVFSGEKTEVAATGQVMLSTTNTGTIKANFNGLDKVVVSYDVGNSRTVHDLKSGALATSSGDLSVNNAGSLNIESAMGLNVTTGIVAVTGGMNWTDSAGDGISITQNGGGDFLLNSTSQVSVNAPSIAVDPGGGNHFNILNSADESNLTLTAGGGDNAGHLILAGGTGANFDGNIGLGVTPKDGVDGGGAFCIHIANATTIPTANPSSGGILYVQGGALKYRSAGGTITTIANN